jgi:hypothetical protein
VPTVPELRRLLQGNPLNPWIQEKHGQQHETPFQKKKKGKREKNWYG